MNTQIQKETIVELPEGFTARGATMNDLESAMAMFNRWSNSVIGQDEITDAEAIGIEWKSPGFDPAEDIRLIFASNGDMAGYIEVWTTMKPPVHPWMWGRVDPNYEDKGVGTWMLQWAEGRAMRALNEVPAELRFAPRVGTYREAEKPKKSFEEGLKRWRYFWEKEGFDPTLLFIAMDGDEIAGINLCLPRSFEDPDLGWVGTLGVRREWRKRGIGLALLRHSFNEFYRRGKRKVGLGVDAQNLTGALHLYEGAGMHVHQAFDQYEKELRPGLEISTQSLSQ